MWKDSEEGFQAGKAGSFKVGGIFFFLENYIGISENHFLINILCIVLTELEISGKG